jgi:hypothetical protein
LRAREREREREGKRERERERQRERKKEREKERKGTFALMMYLIQVRVDAHTLQMILLLHKISR